MNRLLPRIALGIAAGVAVYVGFSIWADARSVANALGTFSWSALALACVLAAANYLVRFVRWEGYLRVLGIRDIPRLESLLVFLAGFSLTVTPGKLGEALKAFLLKASRGIPAARTTPIVIAERVTDLVGCLLLSAFGAFTFDVDRRFLLLGLGAVAAGLLVISVEALARPFLALARKLPGAGRFAHGLDEFYASTKVLLRPAPLAWAVLLSAASWFLECLALWVIVRGFPGAHVDVQVATFVYAATTIAGALSFLPGGLGVTEAGMLALLVRLGTGVTRGVATAATFLVRVATLWFAVALGLGALVLFARRTHVAVDLPTKRDQEARGVS